MLPAGGHVCSPVARQPRRRHVTGAGRWGRWRLSPLFRAGERQQLHERLHLHSSALNYASRSLAYSTSTGLFTGTLTINQCPSYVTTFTGAGSTCITQTFPAPAYLAASLPKAVGLTGVVGFTLQGMNIYNPLVRDVARDARTNGSTERAARALRKTASLLA